MLDLIFYPSPCSLCSSSPAYLLILKTAQWKTGYKNMLGFCLLSTIIICDNILRASIIFRINFPQVALVVKNLPANAGDVRDVGSIAGSERPPGGGNGNPLQRSCLENPKDRGTWWATVHGVAKSWTRLRQLSAHAGMRLSLGQPDCKDQSGCQRVQSATAPGF